ncbi:MULTISPECIES: NAD(P)/FAD-dependent oxidoreductase [unclassified Parafrankia]|uniref:NAD(P)/FAD-dependent oxidoreductase n=1 Tax=unclassified Parafrankia TaxID=2994368 RepID=UPI000DA46CF4|nr:MULTISPECIES: NAD(P)/FAD-dependent oxidoreductase [unclassified Parafrankia]TCJ33070.1 NAD(P)/FAD-dependent oxidoreductase [Parafrankia sp. BMG5.11]CAI7974970.1 UDP-galactopyranose mutase [Frankia sp. Hr75.2]SQD96627.1 Amine oxidase [Parafrankia sp. Ea1.12]
MTEKPEVVVIGAGPAGLSAGWELMKREIPVTIIEGDSVVGGISRTAQRDGWRFDIGGHRFFTKVPEVEKLWHEILPDEDFLLRPRSSRIYYNGKFFDYPLKAGNALGGLGVAEAARCIGSYALAKLRPPKDQSNYENWLVARFGWRLYRTFFKTYTEKLWGVKVSDMPSDWAAQRIKSLSLMNAITNAVLPKRNQKDITSLIEEFQYPKFGPGMMWETAADKIVKQGGRIVFEEKVRKIHHENGRATGVTTVVTGGYGPGAGAPESSRDDLGTEYQYTGDHFISSMSFSSLVRVMDPPVPARVLAAANALKYRDFLTVALVVPKSAGFPDNWIYIHAPDVKVGRIQNFASWSPFLVKDGRTCLGLEYFVFEGDEMWNSSDEELIALGTKELAKLGLVQADQVERGYVVRMPKAYPYYDMDYKKNVDIIRGWLEDYAPNVHPVGRNGMHRYNNQDHSMLTAMLTVENIIDGKSHDVWEVNVEEDYHEEVSSPGRS